MPRDGTSKRSHDELTFRKVFIILISTISILALLVMNIQYLDFNIHPGDFITSS